MPTLKLSTAELKEIARDLRLDILECTTMAGSGHPSSSFSSVEICTTLFFGGILNFDPANPEWPARDRFIMSKGHAAPLLYPLLARAGYFPREMILKLRQIDSPVQGHPILGTMPGVEATAGSLGQGLSLGVGHVLGGRLNKFHYRVYVLIGDGECQAGQVWEAAMSASHFHASNLTAILDYNKYQEMGPVSREMGLEPLVDKWKSFGWHVIEVDGHDLEALLGAYNEVLAEKDKPQIIIAHTVKGKGVSFVEADYTYHGRAISPELAIKAKEEILCS